MVNVVPGLTRSAGGLTASRFSAAAPERLPTGVEQQSLNEFVLQLRSAVNRLETSIALPPGPRDAESRLGLAGPGSSRGEQVRSLFTLPTFEALSGGPTTSAYSAPGARTLTSGSQSPTSGPGSLVLGPGSQASGSSAAGERIAHTAAQFLGSPYVWGGQSPSGFDCTGFTWYVAKQTGLHLPLHDLAGQMASGQHVEASALQPGDLVFFQNTYQPGLSHVGIALGNGRFIHAASETQGVIVSRLDEPYWAQRYVGATRPAGPLAPNPSGGLWA